MDRAQRVDEKNGVICLVITLTPKMAHFLVFSAGGSRKSVAVWTKYLSASERPYLVLSENAKDYWILSYH